MIIYVCLFIFHQISFGDWAVAGSFAFLIFSSIFNMTSAITRVKSTKELREQTFLLRKKIKRLQKKPNQMVTLK